MPQTLTETVEQAYAALSRRDLDGFLSHLDPEVEFTSLIAEAEGARFHGHDGVREWWEKIVVESLGGVGFALEEVRPLDDERVLVKLVISGEAGGVQVEQLIWQAIRVRDGTHATWWQAFRTEEEALEALDEVKPG
jgi:ketosteroid isomerase-like protein